ncbi:MULTISPECIES: RodZ family helix-turn-helix domain-containing protein [unclassified Nostoc]|uniref:helix-turn-helix domain-containing protein n=1 Tax=unclassified Nostoc TaxID=2593658 RepID=UPI002AD38C60|nr:MULTISPECIES: RodZ family helix-turn-helix domain-containing protein [unclassified Nostoc]MDZ8089415.1 helix-turn-helix domain-containing protein [Nostoc sp. DedQUE12b]MDZ8212073.1 helix-turn-helix domain-containing protein [Nostoc sp. ChiSLP03a]
MKWLRKKNKHQPSLSLEEQRAEKLAELGAQLWALRQEQGLSLEQVVALTRIPRRLLQAIEEGNLNDLPEPVYIQGLIRQFADALGLNGVEFSGTFPVSSAQVSPLSRGKTSPLAQLRPIHLYFLYILLIVCSVNGLSQLLNNALLQASNSPNQQYPKQKSVVKPEIAQLKESTQVQPVSDTLSGVQKRQVVQVGVTLKASSWIRVVADGKTEFEGILPEGTHRVWKAQEQLTVKTDNAGGVLVSVNQEKAKEMGEPGKEEEVRIAAKPKF